MECMSGSGLFPSVTEYTEKQKKLIAECSSVISQEGIEIDINRSVESFPALKDVALDVEHDESGEFVGCGLYSGNGIVYYFSDLSILCRLPFSTFNIIAHNGVSDLELLAAWGFDVSRSDLFWDTMLIAHLLDSSQKDFGLKACAKRELAIEYPSYDDIVGKRGLKVERVTLDKQPLELVSKYNCLDTWCTYQLYLKQRKAVGI